MKELLKTRIQQRMQALYHYINAMESGDGETLSAVLQEATQDQVLERMLLEVNEVYQIEDRTVAHPDDVALAQEMLLDIFAESPQNTEEEKITLPIDIRTYSETKPEGPATPHPLTVRHLPARKWYRNRWSAVATVALIAVLIVPFASGFASQFLTLFRVQNIQTVNIDESNPSNLVGKIYSLMQHFGDAQDSAYNRSLFISASNLEQVKQAVKSFEPQLPTSLPDGVSHTPQFKVTENQQTTFVFSKIKTHNYLAQTGQQGTVIPTQLDGAKFTLKLDSGVMIKYSGGQKILAIIEAASPVIESTGPTALSDLRSFVLSLPKLDSSLKTILQHTDVNSGTVPVPIPPQVGSQAVSIHGASGLLLTDSSSGVLVWQTHGVVYIISTLGMSGSQILDTANSLH